MRRKTFVLSLDGGGTYGRTKMEQFVGTYRQLLNEINGKLYDLDNSEEMNDRDFARYLESVNGDGAPFIMAWCVEDRKQVFGK